MDPLISSAMEAAARQIVIAARDGALAAALLSVLFWCAAAGIMRRAR